MAGNVYTWSTTALTNQSADPDINWAEGQLPGTVNGSGRGMMAAIAGLLADNNGTLTTGGSANAYTVTNNIAISALATGLRLIVKANHTNTGAATLNLTPAGGAAFGAKAIRLIVLGGEADPGAGQIATNGRYILQYDTALNGGAGAWILLNPTSQPIHDIVNRTEDTAPDAAADYWLTYDASATALKKVLLRNIVNGLTEDTAPDGAADYGLSYDASASTLKKFLLHRATAFAVGSFTRDLTTATGTQAVTGIGFKPKALVLIGASDAGHAIGSVGFAAASANLSMFINPAGTTVGTFTDKCIFIGDSTNNQTAALASLDADGFTVSWTKNSSPTGTGRVLYLAVR